ncbi:MAG: hypothetical protein QW775_08165 [Ignisphaera sp.]|uniref:Uncharacterized protein n=1 Tax=Ignisphaera aggregans TaxID=334771 RepID=A0A7C4NKD3_9CREN
MGIVRYISRKSTANVAFFIILTSLLCILSFNNIVAPNVIGEVVYLGRIDIPPTYYVAIPINLNPGDVINGTFRSLTTCVVEYCIDVVGFVLDLNNNVVAIFRINYTKPIIRFSFGAFDGGTFRIILINLLTFEAYTELKLERVKGIYSTPPKVIIPTTTIYSTIMSTVTEKIITTTTTYSTTTVEKTMAILLPTTVITTTTDITTVTTTLLKTYTVTQIQQFNITLSTTLHKTTTSTIIGYETSTQTVLLEVSKTMYVPITITTTIVYTQSPSQNLIQILTGTTVILLVAVVSSASYIIFKIIRKK